MAIWIAAGALLAAAPAYPQGEKAEGRGWAVVTVLPKQKSAPPVNVSPQSVSIKVNGTAATVTHWAPLTAADGSLELVLLIDSTATHTLANQFDDMRHFVRSLPPDAKVAIAYMQNGRALLTGPLTADHAQALTGLHFAEGPSVGPYFCLSDLARNWPSADRRARRAVLLVTNGVDPYNPRFDPQDIHVQAAIEDSVRAGLQVYSIYWSGVRLPPGILNGGQSLLEQLTQETGGNSYWMGNGNPVNLQPYFEDLARRFSNQYRLGFSAPLKGKPAIATLKLKIGGIAAQVTAPQQVFVDSANTAQ
jgi:hypothetical protein